MSRERLVDERVVGVEPCNPQLLELRDEHLLDESLLFSGGGGRACVYAEPPELNVDAHVGIADRPVHAVADEDPCEDHGTHQGDRRTNADSHAEEVEDPDRSQRKRPVHAFDHDRPAEVGTEELSIGVLLVLGEQDDEHGDVGCHDDDVRGVEEVLGNGK